MGGIARYDCHMTHTKHGDPVRRLPRRPGQPCRLLGGDLVGAQALIDQDQALYPDHAAAGLSWGIVIRLAGTRRDQHHHQTVRIS